MRRTTFALSKKDYWKESTDNLLDFILIEDIHEDQLLMISKVLHTRPIPRRYLQVCNGPDNEFYIGDGEYVNWITAFLMGIL